MFLYKILIDPANKLLETQCNNEIKVNGKCEKGKWQKLCLLEILMKGHFNPHIKNVNFLQNDSLRKLCFALKNNNKQIHLKIES